MGKRLNHRFARWLRFATVWALLSHDAVAPWMTLPLYAQNPDVITIGVTPFSTAPPAAVTDLLAAANLAVEGQISLSWTAPQGNAGGVPINNQPVVAYSIQYATFSVVSVAGSTTTWWNMTSASDVLLQSPAYVPKTPGQMESYGFSGLIPGVTYYFGIKSISQGGITSPIDTESASPQQQASAFSTIFLTSSGGAPMRPNGLSSSFSGGQFTLTWHPVTLDTNLQPITIDHYVVYRYDDIGSSPTVTATVSPSSLSYTDTVGGLVYFYRVFAVSPGGITSAASDYMDSSPQANRYAIAPDDLETRVVLPGSLAKELDAGFNVYGQDLEIILTRRQQDEVDVTLRSYQVGVYQVSTGIQIPNFAFSSSGMQVQLGLDAIFSAGKLTTSQVQTLKTANTSAGSIAQIVSVYWYNGADYIRISDPVLTSGQALSVSVRNVGIYQVRATQISTTFQLTQNSPYPRVITPNDPSQNNRVFWFFDNPSGDSVTGTIYDIRGAKVRDLAVNSQSPTANSLVWDGRDMNGAVVRSGVYLYRIAAGKESQTGTVVVAR